MQSVQSDMEQHLPVKKGLEHQAQILGAQLSGISAERVQGTLAEVEGAWLQLEQTLPERRKSGLRGNFTVWYHLYWSVVECLPTCSPLFRRLCKAAQLYTNVHRQSVCACTCTSATCTLRMHVHVL